MCVMPREIDYDDISSTNFQELEDRLTEVLTRYDNNSLQEGDVATLVAAARSLLTFIDVLKDT